MHPFYPYVQGAQQPHPGLTISEPHQQLHQMRIRPRRMRGVWIMHAHRSARVTCSLTRAVRPRPACLIRRSGGLNEDQAWTLGTEQALLAKLAEAGVDASDTKISAQREKAPAVVEKVRVKQAATAATAAATRCGSPTRYTPYTTLVPGSRLQRSIQHGRFLADFSATPPPPRRVLPTSPLPHSCRHPP